jgi:hypothetical protein
MNRGPHPLVGIILFFVSFAASAQDRSSFTEEAGAPSAPALSLEARPAAHNAPNRLQSFSRISVGGGVSLLGINMQLSTNLNHHLNLRAIGNVFKYSNSFTISGVPTSANLNLGSAGGMVDYYPFHVGFRVSGGLLSMNHNEVNATADIPGGDSITLNGQHYYSANANPFTGATPLHGGGHADLHPRSPTFILTTGWGNHVGRRGHWSVPIEMGAAFVGTPQITAAISGWACADASQQSCSNVADPKNSTAVEFQDNLNAQVSKWNSDIGWLKSYPIFSAGLAYNFNIRRPR